MFNVWLRHDCANQGGRCGRECSCCEKPPAVNRLLGWALYVAVRFGLGLMSRGSGILIVLLGSWSLARWCC